MTEDGERRLMDAWRRMTPKQQKFFSRFLERMAADKAFALRVRREMEILQSLFWTENYPALERWFNRKAPELVPPR